MHDTVKCLPRLDKHPQAPSVHKSRFSFKSRLHACEYVSVASSMVHTELVAAIITVTCKRVASPCRKRPLICVQKPVLDRFGYKRPQCHATQAKHILYTLMLVEAWRALRSMEPRIYTYV